MSYSRKTNNGHGETVRGVRSKEVDGVRVPNALRPEEADNLEL